MPGVCRVAPVQERFEASGRLSHTYLNNLFLETGYLPQDMLGCTGMHWDALGYTWDALGHAGCTTCTCRGGGADALGCAGTFWNTPVTNWDVPAHVGGLRGCVHAQEVINASGCAGKH